LLEKSRFRHKIKIATYHNENTIYSKIDDSIRELQCRDGEMNEFHDFPALDGEFEKQTFL
jgi:hypothetical protein